MNEEPLLCLIEEENERWRKDETKEELDRTEQDYYWWTRLNGKVAEHLYDEWDCKDHELIHSIHI